MPFMVKKISASSVLYAVEKKCRTNKCLRWTLIRRAGMISGGKRAILAYPVKGQRDDL